MIHALEECKIIKSNLHSYTFQTLSPNLLFELPDQGLDSWLVSLMVHLKWHSAAKKWMRVMNSSTRHLHLENILLQLNTEILVLPEVLTSLL